MFETRRSLSKKKSLIPLIIFLCYLFFKREEAAPMRKKISIRLKKLRAVTVKNARKILRAQATVQAAAIKTQ